LQSAPGGTRDRLRQGDYYVVSAGSGGKHAALSISGEDMHAIHVWFLPGQLYLPPSYLRAHFKLGTRRNRIAQLVGDRDGALPIPQDVRVSRLVSDRPSSYTYSPRSEAHGVYAFVLEGEMRCSDTQLGRRDSMGVWGRQSITCATTADETDVLFVETIM